MCGPGEPGQQLPVRPGEHVLRRGAAADHHLRARHHAVHHGEHHPAAADRGDPRLEALKKEGQSGTAKITQYTRYLTIALAVLQGTGLVATAKSGALFSGCTVADQVVPDPSIFTIATMVITMTAGTAVVMWLGELITDRGIGNGMSILMFISIAAGFPGALWKIKVEGDLADGWIEFGTVILVGFAMVGLVVFVEQAQRRIPVQYAKRMIGRRSYGGTSTYIPLKVNQAGVIPVIFASSLLYIPALIAQFSSSTAGGRPGSKPTSSRVTTPTTSLRTSF